MRTSGVATRGLSRCGTWLSCSVECGIFPDQGLNLCLLHWQVDFLPLSHQARPGTNELESENISGAILGGADVQSIKFRNVPIIVDWSG